MKIILFDDKINGHHLEYIHHFYEVAVLNPEHQFIFVLPDDFLDVRNKLLWEKVNNITFDLFPKEIVSYPEGTFMNSIKKSIGISKLVNLYCRKHNADTVFMNTIISLIPASVFYITSKVKISGIIYQIYLYRDHKSSLLVKLFDRLKYLILSKSRMFENVFILNDEVSANKLNEIYKSRRFLYLSDPYIKLTVDDIDIRKTFNVPNYHKLFIHIGALEKRKGTLAILNSIINLPPNEKDKYTFFFAGRVDNDIRTEFYNLVNIIKDVNIIIRDEFCSYGFFASLCKEADAILMPYLIDSASSGIIGYASQFKTPVIATSTGLIGELVKKYKLGYLLPSINEECLIQSYRCVHENSISRPDNTYCESHTVDNFKKIISDVLF